jgi:hypothetical protein
MVKSRIGIILFITRFYTYLNSGVYLGCHNGLI